ncbi:MAG: CBS domain-containing protein [Caldilineaceae bacterium]
MNRTFDIIVTHERTDFDALASLLGAALLFPEAYPVLPRQLNRNVREFLALYHNHFRFISADDLPRGRVGRTFVVDARTANSPRGTQHDTEYIIIDHHAPARDEAGEQRKLPANTRELWCGDTGANTTLLVEKLIEHGILVSPLEATLLALGIYEDTGNLTYASTTHRDAAALAWLLDPQRGVNLREVNEFLHHPITEEQRDLLQDLMEHSQFLDIAGYRVVIATASAHGFTDELSTLAARLRDFHEPDAVFVVVDLGDVVQVVARSTTDAVDVGKITQVLGGGGHNRAAAAHLREVTLDELRDRIVELVRSTTRAAGTVREIMSMGRPQVLRPDTPIQEAARLMRRWGHEGFPVVQPYAGKDQLLGVLTRREADRAIDHGMGELPVQRFMRAGQVTVTPDDSIATLRKRMIDSNWGQIPVVDGGQIIGIVTRTDLIKLWDEANLPDRRAAEIAQRLRRALNPVQYHLLERVGAEVDRMNYAVYVVGGFVRDLMLDRAGVNPLSLDVDIVIEGDAIAFARRMQSLYGGRVIEHKRFGTAKWQLKRAQEPVNVPKLLRGMSEPGDPARMLEELPAHLDFVTARTEFYTEPAVLPTVQQGSIKLDLHRRDFTINTLALCLNPDRWGNLLDFWNGLNDLNAGLVRVLHSLSFVDDATRIMRAVRYEQRFGFRIEERTLELLQDALELLTRVTPARIRHELERILEEEEPEKPMLRLDELHVLRTLYPDLRMTAEMAREFALLRELRGQEGANRLLVETPIVLLYWGIITYPMPGDVLEALQERLGLKHETLRLMQSLARLRARLPVLADPAARPSQIVAALDDVDPVALALLPVLSSDTQVLVALDRYCHDWRQVQAVLDGNDLQALGLRRGTIYRTVLAELRAGRLDGTINSREEETAYVLRTVASQ